jgi:hypothetical protein
MKKFLKLLLALGLVAGFAAGCSSDSDSGSGGSSSGDIKMGRANFAAHGNKSFAVAVVAMDGEKIVGASMDEFQFMNKSADGVVPVPNADATDGFGAGFADANKPLASKLDSTKYYSENMKKEVGSTVPLHENYAAIEKYVTGKTVAELEKELGKYDADNEDEKAKFIDVVSGSTLADTYGYVSAFVEAAKNVK